MHKLKSYILFFIIFICFISSVNAANNPYPKYEESAFGGKIINCTWYAWQQAKDNTNVELPLWTYVQTWYNKAEKAGYSVGKEPKAKSIMVWNYGEGFGGHVAYVTNVNGNTITFNEGGSPMTKDGVYIGNTLTMEEMSSFLVGFIYLENAPKTAKSQNKVETTAPNEKKTPAKEKIEPKKEETVKSSNNYLSELKINNIDFKFEREIVDYIFDVGYANENVTIVAKAEDNTARVDGNGTFSLKVGENNFNITVTAEDNTTKEYHIMINRKEENKKEVQETLEEKTIKPKVNENKKIIIVVSILGVLIIASIVFILIKKNSKKIFN